MSGYSLAYSMPPQSDILPSLSGMLFAVADARKIPKGQRQAGLWDYNVPRSQSVANLIRAYAANSCELVLSANGIDVGAAKLDQTPPRVVSGQLLTTVNYSIFGGQETRKEVLLPLPDSRTAALCSGGWVDLGQARLRLGSLLPEITYENNAAVLRWRDPPQLELGSYGLLGLIRRWTRTTLREIHIGEEFGEFVTSGLVGWALPRLKWST